MTEHSFHNGQGQRWRALPGAGGPRRHPGAKPWGFRKPGRGAPRQASGLDPSPPLQRAGRTPGWGCVAYAVRGTSKEFKKRTRKAGWELNLCELTPPPAAAARVPAQGFRSRPGPAESRTKPCP